MQIVVAEAWTIMVAQINWAFAGMCDRAQSMDEVQEVLVDQMHRLGFAYVACASHVDPLKPPPGAVMMVDYPEGWVAYFSDQGFAKRDPMYATASRQTDPFDWSHPKFRRTLDEGQRNILAAAADAGLVHGYTIPIHAPDALPASCSLVANDEGIDVECVRQAHWYALFAHEAARRLMKANEAPIPRHKLYPRERDCIEWFARGKTDAEIGMILGVSEHTVHNTVRRLLERYGVATRMQVFVRALADGEIALHDIAD